MFSWVITGRRAPKAFGDSHLEAKRCWTTAVVAKSLTGKLRFVELVSLRDKSMEIAGVNKGIKQSRDVLELASHNDSDEVKLTSGMGVRRLGQCSIGWS